MKLGVDAETARAAAAYAAGNLMMSPYTGAMQAAAGYDQNRAGLFGGITTGLLSNPNFMGGSGNTGSTGSGGGAFTPTGIQQPPNQVWT